MAERRMFTKKITDDERFYMLPSSTQLLYFHLSMSADDDGFNNQISLAMFKAHASVADLETLLEKRYVYQFENGVLVIKHWRMANALRKDRYTPTVFQDELAQLDIKENGSYTWLPSGCQVVANCLPQDRLGKESIDKDSVDKESIGYASDDAKPKPQKHKFGEFQKVLLTDDEYNRLADDFGVDVRNDAIRFLDEYIEEKGYKSKSHNLAIRRWVVSAVKEKKQSKRNSNVIDWDNV